jgi:hypothetical protein
MKYKPNLLQLYSDVAGPLIRRLLTPNCCIGACKITVEVLKRFKLDARVQPTKFAFGVSAMSKTFTSGLSREELIKATDVWEMHDNGWNGHLVVRFNKLLIDPSVHQAPHVLGIKDWPEKVLILTMPEDRDQFSATFQLRMDTGLEIELQYGTTTDDSYLTTEAWNDPVLNLIADEIVDQMLGRYIMAS